MNSGNNHIFNIRYLLFAVLFLLYGKLFSQVYFNNLDFPDKNINWIGMQTVDSGAAYSGYYYAHTDSLNTYGLGIHQSIPENLISKNTVLVVSAFARSNNRDNDALYVITIENERGKTQLWKGISPGFDNNNTESWTFFSDTILIPASITKNTKIKSYLWNKNRKNSTDIDDLKFEFSRHANPTFVPNYSLVATDGISSSIYSNNYYSVLYNKETGLISIRDMENNQVVKNFNYYSERELRNKKLVISTRWKFVGSRVFEDGRKYIFKASAKGVKLKMEIYCEDNSGNIRFDIRNTYNGKQKVFRESIISHLDQSLAEVYRNNRKSDRGEFQLEYWLDNEGLKTYGESSSLFIYHNPGISSLQLNTEKNLLFINLDYEKDHPFFRFPLNADSNDWKVDQSYSYYHRKKSRHYSFSITVSNYSGTLPRFMKNPSGYESTYIWSEHADFTNIRTNRAVYFGSEKIHQADSAIGGFVYFDIPVTKSVFYDNPDSVTNFEASNGVFSEVESSILTDSKYADFLFQISQKGHDICLHTPDHYTTTPDRLEEALFYMKENFGSPSWIDHGNNNGPENNREDLICDATIKKSPLYALDLWKKYGVSYLHNAYYEELNTYKDWLFEPSIEKPYSGYGDFFPKPDYYRHQTLTKDLYHWTTTSAMFVREPNLWSYLFNPEKMRNFVDNWYVEINHVYPAWVDPQKGMWMFSSDSTIIAQPGFNTSLAVLSELRDKGRLNITTIANFLDYRTAIDNVQYELMNDGRIIVTNNNDVPIHNLSMAVKAAAVTVNQLMPSYKLVGSDIVFWFDINPGESKIIRIVQ